MTEKICSICNEPSAHWWCSSPRVCIKLHCKQKWAVIKRGKDEKFKEVRKENSRKELAKIREAKQYYKVAILKNIAKNNGKCICEECGDEIKNPGGINVSHIISKGANPTLYLDPLNHFILCRKCEQIWTSGSGKEQRSTMKVAARAEEVKVSLTNKYYNK